MTPRIGPVVLNLSRGVPRVGFPSILHSYWLTSKWFRESLINSKDWFNAYVSRPHVSRILTPSLIPLKYKKSHLYWNERWKRLYRRNIIVVIGLTKCTISWQTMYRHFCQFKVQTENVTTFIIHKECFCIASSNTVLIASLTSFDHSKKVLCFNKKCWKIYAGTMFSLKHYYVFFPCQKEVLKNMTVSDKFHHKIEAC